MRRIATALAAIAGIVMAALLIAGMARAQDGSGDDTTFAYGETVQGEITNEVTRQEWQFTGATGDVIDIVMSPTSGDLDAVVSLFSPGGDVLAFNDGTGSGQDAGIFGFRLPFGGSYTIVTRRDGPNSGRLGTTTGRYTLTVTSRGETGSSTPLNENTTLRGRLSPEFPRAVYQIIADEPIALTVDSATLHRLMNLRILDASGAELQRFSGLDPLITPVVLPSAPGAVYVEVSAVVLDDQPETDFALSSYTFGSEIETNSDSPTGLPRPLRYNNPPELAVSSALQTWFFIGTEGDLAQISITPEAAVLGTQITVTGPRGLAISSSSLGAGFRQPITLPVSGLYQVAVRASGTPYPYSISVRRDGADRVAFARFQSVQDIGRLQASSRGTLPAGRAHAYWLDVVGGKVINVVAQSSLNVPLFVGVQRPDGSFAAFGRSEGAVGATLEHLPLDGDGRYRVVVYSLDAADVPYTLIYEESSGGELLPGVPAKGIVSSVDGLATWEIDVPAGTLINVRATNFTPLLWSPLVAVALPDGRILASNNRADNASLEPASESDTRTLLGIQAPVSGRYHVIVAGEVTGTFASYQLLANIQAPFAVAAQPNDTIRVNATRPPADRYVPTEQLEAVPVSRLIRPAVNPETLGAPDVEFIGFGNTVRGEIPRGTLHRVFRFGSGADVALLLNVISVDSAISPSIMLLDQNGALLAETFQTESGTTNLYYRTRGGGTFYAVVSMGLEGGQFLLSLNTLTVRDNPLDVRQGTPIIYGQTVFGELLQEGEVDTYFFAGAGGDEITLNAAVTAGTLEPALELIGPRNQVISIDDSIVLPEPGVYTIRVGSVTTTPDGRYSLTLALATAVQRVRGGGLLPEIGTVRDTLTQNDSEDVWLFSGREGEWITLEASILGEPSATPISVRLQDTAGNTFAARDSVLSARLLTFRRLVLPATGVYRVQVIGGQDNPGAYSLTLNRELRNDAIDVVDYGATVGGVFSTTRNAKTWVLSGTAGDTVSIAMRYVRGDRFSSTFQVVSDTGVPLALGTDNGNGAQVDVFLPFTGSYNILVGNIDTGYTGRGVYALSVALRDSRARSVGGIVAPNDEVFGDLYADDPQDTWLLNGRGGSAITISVRARDSFLAPAVEVRTPFGELIASSQPDSESGIARIDDLPLSASGVYVVRVTGTGAEETSTTGAYSLSLVETPPAALDLQNIAYGQAINGVVADDRPFETYQFNGQKGDVISASVTREPGGALAPVVELRTDSGVLLARGDAGLNSTESAALTDYTLPQTGVYHLVATRHLRAGGSSAGRYEIRLDGILASVNIRASIQYGQQAIGRLNDQTPQDRLSFEGRAGDVIGITTRATSGDLDLALTLEDSAGNVLLTSDDQQGTNPGTNGFLLPVDGTYTLVLYRIGNDTVGSTGNYELLVSRLYQVPTTVRAFSGDTITYGQRVVGTVDPTTSEVLYTFNGTQGDVISLDLLHPNDDAPPVLVLRDPAANVLAQGRLTIGQTRITDYTLPITGSYLIQVLRAGDSRQIFTPYALTLSLSNVENVVPAVQSDGGVLSGLEPIIGTFESNTTSAHYWLFNGVRGQTLSLDMLRLNGDINPVLTLIAPNAQSLFTVTIPEQRNSSAVPQFSLPVSGVYSILITPGGNSGQYRLTFQLSSSSTNNTNAIREIFPGTPVTGLIDAVKERDQWSFVGRQGDTVTVRMVVTSGDLTPRVVLLSDAGAMVAESVLRRDANGEISAVIRDFVLPENGRYILVSGHETAQTEAGTYQLLFSRNVGLSSVAAGAAPLFIGQAVADVIQQGSRMAYAFEGARGDVITVDTSGAVQSVELYDPAGNVVASAEGGALANIVLRQTGRYAVVLSANETTPFALLVQRRNAFDGAAILTLQSGNGSRPLPPNVPQQNGITSVDPVDYWLFNAEAGQVVQIEIAGINGNLRPDAALYGADGFLTAISAPEGVTETVLGPFRIPQSGTYLLVVSRYLGAAGGTVGSYRVLLTLPPDASGSVGGVIPAYGSAVAGAITASDPADEWTFSAQAGDVVQITARRTDENTDLIPSVTLNGEPVTDRLVLPTTDTYRIEVSGENGTTGTYSLTVQRIATPEIGSIAQAEGISVQVPVQGEIGGDTPNRAYVFFSEAGVRYFIEAQSDTQSTSESDAQSTSFNPQISVLAPNGQILLVSTDPQQATLEFLTPSEGFYGIVISASPLESDPVGGAFTLTLNRIQPGATFRGALTVGRSTTGVLSPEQPIDQWDFTTNSANIPISAWLTADISGTLQLVGEDGRIVTASAEQTPDGVRVDAILPTPGRYSVLVSASDPELAGTYQLRLDHASSPTGGGLLITQSEVRGSITDADFSDTWRLDSAQMPDTLTAERISGDLLVEITVFSPANAVVGTYPADEAGTVLVDTAAFTETGMYTLIVSRQGGARGTTTGDYTLR
jgi:hypothetical protein